jgi:GNAT superfamily N-acetyltransferase
MVLLARLAIDESHQGEGLGRDLLVEAIERATSAGTQVAARFIGVDPIDERARAFYAHFSFRDVPGDPQGRMFLRIDEAILALRDAAD